MQPTVSSWVGVAVLVLLQAVGMRVRDRTPPRPTWLSAASGISVGYVFADLLPALGRQQERWLRARPQGRIPWLEDQVYLAALIGLLLAFGLNRWANSTRRRRTRFALVLGAYSLYSLLIGGWVTELGGPVSTAIGVFALGMHLIVNDHSLVEVDGAAHQRIGRMVLAASILAGFGIALTGVVPTLASAALFAILAGAILFNVLRNELSAERTDRVVAFVAGSIGYAVLLEVLELSLQLQRPPG